MVVYPGNGKFDSWKNQLPCENRSSLGKDPDDLELDGNLNVAILNVGEVKFIDVSMIGSNTAIVASLIIGSADSGDKGSGAKQLFKLRRTSAIQVYKICFISTLLLISIEMFPNDEYSEYLRNRVMNMNHRQPHHDNQDLFLDRHHP